MTFSDDTLKAYLQGSLGPEESDAIENAVENDPELEQRLMDLDPIAPVVREVFRDIPAAAPHFSFQRVKGVSPGEGECQARLITALSHRVRPRREAGSPCPRSRPKSLR